MDRRYMFLKERITYVRFYLNEDHYRTPVNMDEFVRYNWRNMLEANFNNSKIYDAWLEISVEILIVIPT